MRLKLFSHGMDVQGKDIHTSNNLRRSVGPLATASPRFKLENALTVQPSLTLWNTSPFLQRVPQVGDIIQACSFPGLRFVFTILPPHKRVVLYWTPPLAKIRSLDSTNLGAILDFVDMVFSNHRRRFIFRLEMFFHRFITSILGINA